MRPPAPGQRWPSIERAWIVIGAVLIGALAVAVLSALMAPERHSDMWVDLVSRSAQLIVLALTGGVVATVVRDRDRSQEDIRRREAFLKGFLDEVEVAFSQVKTSRRLIRTYGFDAPRDALLTPEQVSGFRTELALLNDAELQFETLARRVEALPDPFGDVSAPLARELTSIATYLRDVLREWQADPAAVVSGGSAAALAGWTRFRLFVGYDADADKDFSDGVADRVIAIEVLIHDASTRDARGSAGEGRADG